MSNLNMIIQFLFCCFLTAGISLGVQVHQSPSAVIRKAGDDVQLVCTHGQTDYTVMLWYQQSPADKALKLIGYLEYGRMSYEGLYKEHFNITGDLSGNTAKNGSLFIVDLKESEHSAVYYCAARYGGNAEAYFGGGTKLTVLEKDRKATRPLVKVLQPSEKECKNKRGNAEKTIVCVATRFYPDHVSVSWQVNGEDVSTGVATDNTAQREDKYYTITSRLRVSAKDWYNPNTEFTCTVSFYNGTDTEIYPDSISGAKAKEGVLTREKYLKITQTAKFSYGVFIVKSMVYGVFVAFLVWKLQNSSGKRNH